jgi:hypothetical protein
MLLPRCNAAMGKENSADALYGVGFDFTRYAIFFFRADAGENRWWQRFYIAVRHPRHGAFSGHRKKIEQPRRRSGHRDRRWRRR